MATLEQIVYVYANVGQNSVCRANVASYMPTFGTVKVGLKQAKLPLPTVT